MITTLLAGLALNFPGGDVSALAKNISDATSQDVVFEAGTRESVKGFAYSADDLNEMARAILNATGFKRAPGAQHVFHHGRLPGWLFGTRAIQRTARHDAWKASAGLPENSIVDGVVTFTHKPGESTALSQIPLNLLAKPLEVHWIFHDLGFKASVQELPVQDFLTYVAKAHGGRLIQKPDRWVIDLDPAEIQRRALATVLEVQKHPNYRRLGLREQFETELTRAGIASLGAAQLSNLLATDGGRIQFEITAAMRPAIYQYVMAMLQNAQTEEQERQVEQQVMSYVTLQEQGDDNRRERELRRLMDQRRGGRNNTSRLMRIDPRIWGIATIDSKFNVTLQVATVPDQLGRQGPAVRLP